MAEEKREKKIEEKRTDESVNADFEFRYSADEHKRRNSEIERIRNQYIVKKETEQEADIMKNQQEDKLERLKKLDEKAKQPALIVSLALGVGGTLVLGLGMSMCLAMDMMVLGIIIGVLGMVTLALAFPAHQYLLKKGKEKYRDEIVELSQELLEN